MSLFNYSKCDECKMLKITTLKVLNEYFLPEITKKVLSYHCCQKCSTMMLLENDIPEEIDIWNELSKIEKQIQYLMMINEPLCNPSHSTKKQIASLQNILKKHRLSPVLQLYIKSHLKVFRCIHDSIGRKKHTINNVRVLKLKTSTFRHNDKFYRESELVRFILHSYLMNLFMYEIDLINPREIEDYLDEIFD